MKIVTQIPVTFGDYCNGGIRDPEPIEVSSHYLHNDRVWLKVPGAPEILVPAADLKRAVDNACNHR